LWVRLQGEVEIDLVGKIRIVGKRFLLRTSFENIPDVAVSTFRLNFVAGRQGPIGLIRSVCSARVRRGLVADFSALAHSGRRVTRRQRIAVDGCRATTRAVRRPQQKTSRERKRRSRR
jgi:hypothetical protein